MEPLQRQGLITTVKELRKIAGILEKEEEEIAEQFGMPYKDAKHQINIINFSKESDTWKFEGV
jgi:hypothetical protein